MRRIYLIRHGHPDFPLGAHMCLGRTDTPLGALGRMQAALLGERLRGRELSAVYASPLLRCRQTAAPLEKAPILVEALAEQDMGPWDGLDFDSIRDRWPELYDRRAQEPLLVPPGAETLSAVQARVLPALYTCIQSSSGDIAVVAHASVLQAILAALTETPLAESRGLRLPYAGCAILQSAGTLRVESLGALPAPPLTRALAETLLSAAGPGEAVEAHSRAVAAEAVRLAAALPLNLNRELLYCAALLHDIARSEKAHAQLGAAWLRELGYNEVAALVETHHDWEDGPIDEKALLYLADKCVREDRRVTLEERFAASRSKCRAPEALAAHERRYRAACALRDRVNVFAGQPLVR